MLGVCWAVGCTYVLVSFAFSYTRREMLSKNYIFPILTSVFLIFSILSYVMIYKHIRDHNKKSLKKTLQVTTTRITVQQKRPSLKFRVPVLIILTFFLFIALPSVSQMLLRESLTKNLLLVHGLLYSLGFICDALIYLFLHPTTKKLLYSNVACLKEKRHRVVDVRHTSFSARERIDFSPRMITKMPYVIPTPKLGQQETSPNHQSSSKSSLRKEVQKQA